MQMPLALHDTYAHATRHDTHKKYDDAHCARASIFFLWRKQQR